MFCPLELRTAPNARTNASAKPPKTDTENKQKGVKMPRVRDVNQRVQISTYVTSLRSYTRDQRKSDC